MDLQSFERAVMEISRIAVLAAGCFCMLAIAAATGIWMLKSWLRLLGLYGQFLQFIKRKR